MWWSFPGCPGSRWKTGRRIEGVSRAPDAVGRAQAGRRESAAPRRCKGPMGSGRHLAAADRWPHWASAYRSQRRCQQVSARLPKIPVAHIVQEVQVRGDIAIALGQFLGKGTEGGKPVDLRGTWHSGPIGRVPRPPSAACPTLPRAGLAGEEPPRPFRLGWICRQPLFVLRPTWRYPAICCRPH